MELCAIGLLGGAASSDARASGTWLPCRTAPNTFRTLLLLSDGAVMAGALPSGSTAGNQWYRLTPDNHGSYVNGTWSALAPMHDTRLAFSSAVLRDGRVFVAGAEYGTGTTTAEVYDPISNIWTMAPPSGQSFVDSISKILPGGDVLIAPVFPNLCGRTMIYHPESNRWSAGPVQLNACNQDEASWVKLPDGSILTIDPFGTNTERYIPAVNQWVNDATVPVAIYDSTSELGAALLLADGRALFLGGTGHTALYTPSGDITPGSWAAGPDIPNGQGTSDAPAAMMVNGRAFCVVGPAASANPPASFYEYDPVANSFTRVNGPTGATDNVRPQDITLLDLPDGTVLFSDYSTTLYVYRPDGAPLSAGQPAIASVTPNPDGSYHLTGTLLNGISEGAAFGDDLQMDSNYPLVRLSDSAGNLYYARTYNWSSTGVMTGANPETTEFTLPGGLPAGTYSLVVVANGNSSDPVSFNADALRLSPLAGFAASGSVGGSFTPQSQQLLLTNAGAAVLTWTAASTALWLSVLPTGGTLTPGGPAATVTLTVNAASRTLGVGSYSGLVWITNLATGFLQNRSFNLVANPSPLLQPYFNTVQLFNPAGYWRLDETNVPAEGGTATNLGTLAKAGNGTFSGVVAWLPGPLASVDSTATSFEGISAVAVPYFRPLSLAAPFTLEAWVQPGTTQSTGNVGCPLACGHFDTSRSGWLVYQTDTGWNFRMYNQNQLNTSLNIEAGGPPVAGQWYHLAAVYDGSRGYLYVNGAANSDVPSSFVPNTDGPFTIGTRSDNAFGFQGVVGEVAIYTNALNAPAVLAHFQNGTNLAPSSSYSQLVLSRNPLIYMHLDAPLLRPVALNSGSLGTPAQGFYQLGCVPGVAGVPLPGLGANNHGCQFNGAAGYVNVPGGALNFTNSMSLAAWVQASPANGRLQCILGKGDDSYRLEMDGDGYPLFADGLGSPPVRGVARIDDGDWHQLIGVYDDRGTNYLYVDGLLASRGDAATPPAGTDLDLRLGGAPDAGTDRNFSGTVDEVALFTNVLSVLQVRQLYFATTNAAALSPEAPVVQTPTLATPNSLFYSWTAAPGLRYQVQYRLDLAQSAWFDWGSSFTATDTVISVSIPLGPERQRFYRTRLLP
jgi:hypothetical protein